MNYTGMGMRRAAAGIATDTVVYPYTFSTPGWAGITGELTSTDWDRFWSTGQVLGGGEGWISPANAENGDWFEIQADLAAGTYKMVIIHGKGSDQGIMDIAINGTEEGSFDQYLASSTGDLVETITGVSVPTDGEQTIRFTTDGKNASSTDYAIIVTCFSMFRTGA